MWQDLQVSILADFAEARQKAQRQSISVDAMISALADAEARHNAARRAARLDPSQAGHVRLYHRVYRRKQDQDPEKRAKRLEKQKQCEAALRMKRAPVLFCLECHAQIPADQRRRGGGRVAPMCKMYCAECRMRLFPKQESSRLADIDRKARLRASKRRSVKC